MEKPEQPAYPHTSQVKITTNFGPIHVTVTRATDNSSAPPLLTYHDIGLNHRTCFSIFFHHPDMFQILKHFTIYHIDSPGHQDGSPPPREGEAAPTTIPHLGQLVSAVCDHFSIKHAIGMGVGAGATVLLHAAVQQPEHFRALILFGGSGSAPSWTEWGWWKKTLTTMGMFGLTNALREEFLSRYFPSELMEEGSNSDLVQSIRLELDKMNAAHLARYMDAYSKRESVLGKLEKSRLNLLLFTVKNSAWDENDCVDIAAVFKEKRDSNVNLIPMEHVGHLMCEQVPQKLVKPIEFFLNGLGFLFRQTEIKLPEIKDDDDDDDDDDDE